MQGEQLAEYLQSNKIDYALETGRVVDQVSEKDMEWITCSYCLNIVVQPLECIKCEGILCTKCIYEWTSRKDECPRCRETPGKFRKPHRLYLDILDQVKVTCDYMEKGCQEKIGINNILRHIEQCEYTIVRCVNVECPEEITKNKLKDHLDVQCGEQSVSCDTCKLCIKRKDKALHNCFQKLSEQLGFVLNQLNVIQQQFEEYKQQSNSQQEQLLTEIHSIKNEFQEYKDITEDKIQFLILQSQIKQEESKGEQAEQEEEEEEDIISNKLNNETIGKQQQQQQQKCECGNKLEWKKIENTTCHLCNQSKSETRWYCTTCNIQYCGSCKSYPNTCPLPGHVMSYKFLFRHICNKCHGTIYTSGKRCDECDFDLCSSCS